MNSEALIKRTEIFVAQSLSAAEGGHDWWHVERVRRMALHIAAVEKGCLLIVELGALLHDIADAKFHRGDEEKGARVALHFLQQQGLSANVTSAVQDIVSRVSFKGGERDHLPKSAELQIVQDADRLDALGAIGIARTFNYGGYKNRPLYQPDVPPQEYASAREYRASEAPTLNHFYEKLLLLKDKMNTPTGRKIAAERHAFMEQYVERFLSEWQGRDWR